MLLIISIGSSLTDLTQLRIEHCASFLVENFADKLSQYALFRLHWLTLSLILPSTSTQD